MHPLKSRHPRLHRYLHPETGACPKVFTKKPATLRETSYIATQARQARQIDSCLEETDIRAARFRPGGNGSDHQKHIPNTDAPWDERVLPILH